LVLKNGLSLYKGDVNECLNLYLKETIITQSNEWKLLKKKQGAHFVEIHSELKGKQPAMNLHVNFRCNSTEPTVPAAFVAIDIKNSLGVTIMQALPELNPFISFNKYDQEFNIEIEILNLIPDRYYLSFWMGPHNTETYDFVEDAVCFDIVESPVIGRVFPHTKDHGFMVPQSKLLSNA
jgi:lipopolysaccharide transport system ATP-binding protein